MQEVVGEILFDHVALITTADHKLIDAVCTEDLEDVPEDGTSTDFDHRLWLEMDFLADAGAEPTAKMAALIRLSELTQNRPRSKPILAYLATTRSKSFPI